MPYTIRRSPQARRDIRDFFRFLRKEAGVAIAHKYLEALEYDMLHLIANNPHAFSLFHETGAPYRAKLFKLARTTYWIVYTVDDANETIDLLRFWNSAREPGTHDL
jgi:plasmid stabilization system protein ParE